MPEGNPGGSVLLALVGPTASGKSRMAVEAALELANRGAVCEIVSCDALAVYRGLDVVAAKPSGDERAAVAHHLLDLVDVTGTFTAVAYRQAAREAISAIHLRGGLPLLVGGSGLYFRSVTADLEFAPQDLAVRAMLEDVPTDELWRRLVGADPDAPGWLDPRNRRRVVRAVEILELTGRPPSELRRSWDRPGPFRVTALGLTWDRRELFERAELRLNDMLHRGMLEEVRRAAARGLSQTAAQGVGVKEFVEHIAGRMSLDDAVSLYLRNVKRLIRRQLSWFRGDDRIEWADASELGWDGARDVVVERFAGELTGR